MKKAYVLDTNTLIHDFRCINKFEDNDVYIPITVLEELDSLKNGIGEVEYSARSAIKMIDILANGRDLAEGITLPGGGKLSVLVDDACEPELIKDMPDNRIISSALRLKRKVSLTLQGTEASLFESAATIQDLPVILVSKDAAVRIKANAVGLKAQDYLNDKTTLFSKYGKILQGKDHTNGITSVRYMYDGDRLTRIVGEKQTAGVKKQRQILGITPKNIEQEAVLDAILNDDIDCIAVTGNAGSGKTLLSLAAALYLYDRPSTERAYDQIIVARPTIPLGKNDLGFLPGDINDKIAPWMQPIFDNLDVIVKTPEDTKDNRRVSKFKSSNYLVEQGIIKLQALAYIRGRSLPKKIIILDEAQNTTPLDVKTVITRCGEGTKVILLGDLAQIDTPYLDAESNGLSHLISRFINYEKFCYLHLSQSVRSELAHKAAELL